MDIEVIIEVPQGSRNKYEMDAASGRLAHRWIRLCRLPDRRRTEREDLAAEGELDGLAGRVVPREHGEDEDHVAELETSAAVIHFADYQQ